MKNSRKVYNENYYRAQLIINDPKFKNLIKKLLKAFSKLGCPVPKDGFKTYKEYFEWSDKYLSKRAKIEYSKSFRNKITKITSGRISWGDKEQKQIETLENKELPPMYGESIDNLLFDFGLKRDEKYYSSLKDFIIGYIFFNIKEYNDPYTIITWRRNEKLEENELFIKILPDTRKEDIEKIWSKIREEQKLLPGYKERDRQYKKFNRDLEIYNIYKDCQKKKLQNKGTKELAVISKRADHQTWNIINEKCGDLSWETIRGVVNNIEKLKNSVGFKGPH